MSNRMKAVVGMLVTGLVLFAVFLVVGIETIGPKVSRGAEINSTGYMSLIVSALGSMGFTVAGVLTALMHFVSPSKPVTAENVAEVVELTTSFAALMKDTHSRAGQRRFIFALADASSVIPGVDVTHEGDVVVIRYSGYAGVAQ